jgi:hypothetical protein
MVELEGTWDFEQPTAAPEKLVSESTGKVERAAQLTQNRIRTLCRSARLRAGSKRSPAILRRSNGMSRTRWVKLTGMPPNSRLYFAVSEATRSWKKDTRFDGFADADIGA